MKFFWRVVPYENDFAPEIHQWIVQFGDLFLYPLKDTDRWTPYGGISDFVEVPKDEAPVEIRKKAGSRLGAFKSAQAKLKNRK